MIELLPRECLSELQLDRHLLSMEDPQEKQRTLEHLQGCSQCQGFLLQMRQDRESFLAQDALPHGLQQAMEQSFPESPGDSWLRPLLFAGCYAAAMFAFVYFGDLPPSTRPLPPKGRKSSQTKRSPKKRPPRFLFKRGDLPLLLVGLKRKGKVRMVSSGIFLKPRDRIGLAYRWDTPKKAYLFVVHRDPQGKLSPLQPDAPDKQSLAIRPGKDRGLPDSFEADDATRGIEELWGCFSHEPLPYPIVAKAIPKEPGSWTPKRRGACRYLVLFQLRRGRP